MCTEDSSLLEKDVRIDNDKDEMIKTFAARVDYLEQENTELKEALDKVKELLS